MNLTVVTKEVMGMSKREWFVLGAAITVALVFYATGRADLHDTLQNALVFGVYIVARLGLGFLKISEDVKSGVMAIVVALLLIWRLDASSLLIVALVALNFFTGRAKRKSRP